MVKNSGKAGVAQLIQKVTVVHSVQLAYQTGGDCWKEPGRDTQSPSGAISRDLSQAPPSAPCFSAVLWVHKINNTPPGLLRSRVESLKVTTFLPTRMQPSGENYCWTPLIWTEGVGLKAWISQQWISCLYSRTDGHLSLPWAASEPCFMNC